MLGNNCDWHLGSVDAEGEQSKNEKRGEVKTSTVEHLHLMSTRSNGEGSDEGLD